MSPYINNGCDHYQESNVALSSPLGLTVLLYTEFLCCLSVSKEAFLMNDDQVRNQNLSKAVEILVELAVSLDRERGGQVGFFLALLYEYITVKLLLLRREPTLERFDEIIRLITPLKQAWETIAVPLPSNMATV